MIFEQDVMGLRMKVPVSMSFFSLKLVDKGTIREARDENIKKGEGFVLLHFHSELDMGGNAI
jgi:hypothetical protein